MQQRTSLDHYYSTSNQQAVKDKPGNLSFFEHRIRERWLWHQMAKLGPLTTVSHQVSQCY